MPTTASGVNRSETDGSGDGRRGAAYGAEEILARTGAAARMTVEALAGLAWVKDVLRVDTGEPGVHLEDFHT